MKTSKLILTIFVLTILASCNRKTNEIEQTVNAVIGDISYTQTFGHQPNNKTDENTRLQTHLKYVEKLLRNKDISSLTVEQKENRKKCLTYLKNIGQQEYSLKTTTTLTKEFPASLTKTEIFVQLVI